MSNKQSKVAVYKYLQQRYGQNQQDFSLPELLTVLSKQSTPIAERTLRRWLNNWVEKKLLSKTGQKRGTRYAINHLKFNSNNHLGFLQHIEHEKRPAILASIRDKWTHSSTAIEGNTLSLGDTNSILELGLTISGKPLREHHEIVGHAKAIDLIYQLSHQTLNKDNLYALHKAVQTEVVMDIYQPIGKWKVEKNYSNSINSKGEQVLIEYAKPKEVDGLMTLLIDEINQWDIQTITAENAHYHYAKLHLAFIHIHPFADGNGRLARLISNLPLLKADLTPLLINQEKRREYISLLADYQSQVPTPTVKQTKKSGFWENEAFINDFAAFCKHDYLQLEN